MRRGLWFVLFYLVGISVLGAIAYAIRLVLV